ARRLGRTLPHVWESREVLLPEAAAEFSEKCRNILLVLLQDLTLGRVPDLMLGYNGTEDVQAMKTLLTEWSDGYGKSGTDKTDTGSAVGNCSVVPGDSGR
ncbi:MAG: hypothetical protein IJX14_08370, partial [Clostridia bacterium]|nr:hypothetical protein [Clostridia bacterium]